MPKKELHLKQYPSQQKAGQRKRHYASVAYPESVNPDFIAMLQEQHLDGFISPLHDKDTNADGTPKKPHYHILLTYPSPQSVEQVKPIFDNIGSVGCEPIKNIKSYARYLCHLDNPEKAQYNKSDVTVIGSLNYNSIIQTKTDEVETMHEIFDFITFNQISSFAEFMQVCYYVNYDWFYLIISSKTYVVKEFIKSSYWAVNQDDNKDLIKSYISPITGEIFNYNLQTREIIHIDNNKLNEEE